MKLRFVGKDGSMGLTYNKVYDVGVCCKDGFIWVSWSNGNCPYSSPDTFAQNWSSIKE